MPSGEREIISHIWSLVLAELVNTTTRGEGGGRGQLGGRSPDPSLSFS